MYEQITMEKIWFQIKTEQEPVARKLSKTRNHRIVESEMFFLVVDMTFPIHFMY